MTQFALVQYANLKTFSLDLRMPNDLTEMSNIGGSAINCGRLNPPDVLLSLYVAESTISNPLDAPIYLEFGTDESPTYTNITDQNGGPIEVNHGLPGGHKKFLPVTFMSDDGTCQMKCIVRPIDVNNRPAVGFVRVIFQIAEKLPY